MRVLVTGGTGFLGRHVLAELARRGHQVYCLRRPGNGPVPRLVPYALSQDVIWLSGDLLDVETYRWALASCEGVVHLAPVGVPATEVLLSACSAGRVQHFLFVSALGADVGHEDPFLSAKAQVEELVRQPQPFARTVIRTSLIFGPQDRFVTGIEYWIRRLPALPEPTGRPLRAQPIFVEDLAAAIANLLERPGPGFRMVEAGGPDVLTFGELTELVGAAMGKPLRRVPVPWPMGEAFYVGTSRLGFGSWHPSVFPLLAAGASCAVEPFVREAGLSGLLPFGPAIRRYVESL